MAVVTLANGRRLDTDTGLMVGGNVSDPPPDDPSGNDPYGGGNFNVGSGETPVSSGGAAGPASGGGSSGSNDTSGPFAPSGFNLNVDLYDQINQQARQYGVPAGYLAAAIYYSRAGGFGTGKNQVTPAEISKMAGMLQGQAGQGSWSGALTTVLGAERASLVEQLAPKGVLDPRSVTSPPASSGGTGETAAQKQMSAPATPDDILSLYETYLGRAPDQGAIDGRIGRTYGDVLNEISSSPEAAQFRVQGDKINAIKSNWANSLWQSMFGRPPTNTEIMNIINNGWNPAQTEAFLSNQPYGSSGKTVGQVALLRDAITKSFAKLGLPAPTEGQVNFAVTNNMPITNTDAYATQTAQQQWGTNPAAYTDYRQQIAAALAQYGIIANPNDIDPTLLSSAVNGKWTQDQIAQAVQSGQHPGSPPGTTNAQYKTTSDLAKQAYGTYFPGQPIPQPYMNQFLTMTPDQIVGFIRGLPSQEAAAAGTIVPVGTYNDAKVAAQNALNQLGVLGRAPSAVELAAFAAHGADAEAINQFYANDSSVNAVNPGAKYGKTREQYRLDKSQIEQGYAQDFETPADLAQTKSQQNSTAVGGDSQDPEWLQAIFKNKINPQQANSMFTDTFKRLGRAPTSEEVGAYQSRHTSTFSGTGAAGSVAQGATGPTMPSLAGPQSGRR